MMSSLSSSAAFIGLSVKLMVVIFLFLLAMAEPNLSIDDPISEEDDASAYSSPRASTPDPNCPAGDLSPCSCYTFLDSQSVTIDCSNQQFNDAQLANYLSSKIPATTKVGKFLLSWNSLTNTPALTAYIAKVSSVDYALNEVDISNNPITKLNLGNLPSSGRNLVTLRASNLSITTVDLGRIYFPGPNICRLDLSGNKQLTTVNNVAHENSCNFAGLSAFLLLNNSAITRITRGGGSNLYCSGETDAIFDLSNNALTNVDGLLFIVNAFNGKAILDLSNNQITSISNSVIQRFRGKTGVNINLSRNNLTTLDATVFKGFTPSGIPKLDCQGCPSFVMNFSFNKITSITSGPLTLDNSGTDGTSPIVIDLSSNAFSSFDSQWLSVTGSAKLILDQNQITTITNAPLPMPGTKGTPSISMRKNEIKSFDASWFKSDTTSLTSAAIDLSYNNITTVITNESLPAWVTNNTIVDLSSNLLTRLDESFFSPIIAEHLKNVDNPSTSLIRIDGNSWDCTAGSCGSFSWWVALNSTAKNYLNLGSGSNAAKCIDGTTISTSTLTPLICQCPTYAADIAPCVCGATSGSTTTLTIDCANNGIGDSKMETIVNNIPATTPVAVLDLGNNTLTRIPAKLPQYKQLQTLIVSKNQITSIGANQLTLPADIALLDLSSNQITKIETNSLPVKYVSGVGIKLDSNNLTFLDQEVFEPMVTGFKSNGFTTAYISAGKNPFDCGSTIGCGGDGWLISDPTLLSFVVNAQCNDESSTPFTSLTALNCQCPSASISPCSCQPTAGSNSALTIDCSNQGLDDKAMKAIVDNIPATTPVDTMDLSGNKLTQIPTGLPQYKTMANLNINSNLIEAVNEGELSLNGPVVKLDMSFNVITKISTNSLPAKYSAGAIINLDNNKLTEFNQETFRPVIQFFIDNSLTANRISIASNNFDCGKSIGCGSEAWLVGTSDYTSFIEGGVCGDADKTAFTDLTTGICLCPPTTLTDPYCTCGLSTGSDTLVTVSCEGAGLGDSGVAKILLSFAVSTPIDTLILRGNNLKRVPSTFSRSVGTLTRFKQLNSVDLSSNAITAISTGDLTVAAPLKFLNLTNNVISSIATAALPTAYLDGCQILIDKNKLSSVDQIVFKSLVDYFKKNNISATISLANNPLDCSLPSCYKTFGWISSSSSTAVNYFQNATCSDGNSVKALPSSCKVPFIPPTSAPFSSTTKRPKNKKKLMVALAVTWVESVLASIFQKG